MTLKQAVGKVHLWLGLVSGLVVFVVSLSGAVFVFQDEVRDAIEPWRFAAAPVGAAAVVLPSRLQAAAVRQHVGSTASWVTYYGPGRSASVYLTDNTGGSYMAFFSPYTGRLLHEQNLQRDFFTIVQYLHMYLLLPPAIGEWVVGPAVIIFVLMLVTGLVLWWPKRRQERRQRLTIKWSARWRRVNYDLHNVLGFYAAAVAFVVAFTGLLMSYPWLLAASAAVANGGQAHPQEEALPAVDTLVVAPAAHLPLVDVMYRQVRQASPTAEMLLIGPAGKRTEPVYCLTYQKSLHYYQRDEYYFHPATGQLLKSLPHAAKSNGKKLGDMNYDLHTGQLLGLGGKIAAFLASLVAASLPVTGILLWWGRKQKSKVRPKCTSAASR